MKNKIVFIVVMLMIALPSFAEDNVVVHWIKKIGNGDNLNEPHAPFAILTKEIVEYQLKIGNPGPKSFITCMSILAAGDSDRSLLAVRNGISMKLRMEDIPKELISKALARRTPIINEYAYDKNVYPDGMPRSTYESGGLVDKDYWGAFEFNIIQRLLSDNDMRFESEAKALLDYLFAPLSRDRWDYDQEKMEEADARWQSPNYMKDELKRILISYLNLFRKKRGEEEIDPYSDNKSLIDNYSFGQDYHYYKMEKWNDFLKKPFTEEEMQRFYEISRQSREESARRAKKYEKEHDQIFLRNAQETLQQKDLTPQEREYLERRINHVKNKKYK